MNCMFPVPVDSSMDEEGQKIVRDTREIICLERMRVRSSYPAEIWDHVSQLLEDYDISGMSAREDMCLAISTWIHKNG